MPGPGRNAATEATLSMPPRWRASASTQARERSVSARTLRSIMASCSARLSSAAGPTSPKPALLTTNSGSKSSAVSCSPIRLAASMLPRSARSTTGRGAPVAAISSAKFARSCSRRATSTVAWPLAANTRASAAPIPTEAPVISVMGRRSAISRVLAILPARGGDLLAQLDPFPRRDAEQIRGAPQQIVLELRDTAIGVDDLPHHLDHPAATLLVEGAVDQAREVIEIDRLLLGCGCFLHQLAGGFFVELEPSLDDGMQLVPLHRRHLAIDRCCMHHEGRSRETVIVILEPARMLGAGGQIGQEPAEGLEHAGSLE